MTSQLFKSFPVADAAEGLHSHLQGALAQHKETTKGTPFTSCVLQSIQIMALCVCVCVKDKHPKHHSFINQRVTFVPFILGTQTSSAAHRRVTCDLALQICELSFLRASLQYRYYPTQPTVSGHYYYSTVSRWRWGEKQLCMFQSCPPGTKRGSSPLKVPRGTAENNK